VTLLVIFLIFEIISFKLKAILLIVSPSAATSSLPAILCYVRSPDAILSAASITIIGFVINFDINP
jgi:hypothetical protein